MALGGSLVRFPSYMLYLPSCINISFSGIEYTDTVTIASGLVISGQSMGVAEASKGFDGVDGILG